ncbi:tail assembly protein [Pragia fontium]|uniref:tail assembly protein n=1 Tax=Pragia fontium TaxID=82985 RepID=UPI00064A1C1C|nr:tail assembly protein [Pragia fontium]AKJ41482.1 phage tail assembly protein [Pragia fontium]
MKETVGGSSLLFKLGGVLGKKFGREHRFFVASPREGIKAMSTVIPGFEQFMVNAHRQGLTFAIFKGKQNISEGELANNTTDKTICIIPMIIGSKRAGMLQTIIGVVIVAVASYFTFGAGGPAAAAAVGMTGSVGTMAMVGASLLIGGVMQMLSPQPKGLSMRDGPDNKPSYAFGGAVNTTMQGNPVGILYGKREIGGAVISAGIFTEDQQ